MAGYAYLPAAHGSPEDGIVVEATYLRQVQKYCLVKHWILQIPVWAILTISGFWMVLYIARTPTSVLRFQAPDVIPSIWLGPPPLVKIILQLLP